MEAVIEIPSPTPRDSETVVTALETAAIFRAKGDAAEALRWLQRAAESAGADGDDERTLAIARTASELSHALHRPASAEPPVSEDTPAPPSRRLPKPPPRTGPTQSAAAHQPPPAPSSRPLPLSPNGRPAYSHTPAIAPAPVNRSAPATQSYQPRYSAQTLPTATPAVTASAARSERRANELPAFSSEGADADVQRSTQPAPAPSVRGRERERAPGLRHAARVSVLHSPNEPGLFLVRLLDDGARPPSDASEALMVLVDPSSTLFSD